ncbi:MAG TPA: AMP-binding protein [Smithellaceae bacterium]|nr:AMP-binding protein [Smithellaceae bacterium]
MYESKPWLKFYGNVPHTIDYPRITMYEALLKTVARYPHSVAYDFFGSTATYTQFAAAIDTCANALAALGLQKGDRITISMPTCPQGIICFYAANKIGVVASMIHPLSTAREIEFYLNKAKSTVALTLDAFYGKFKEIQDKTSLQKLILTRIPDYLKPIMKVGFYVTKGRKIKPVPADPLVIWWKDMMKAEHQAVPKAAMSAEEMAVILYSGGTTGTPKGIMLSNLNFISEGMQVAAWGDLNDKDVILAILPIFHGFGLGVCINAAFMGGARSILVPMFTPEILADLIKTKQPSFVIGVPTLYEALCHNKKFCNANLSCLRASFSGADTLPRPVKEQFESVVKRQGGKAKLREGYGLTEAVTAIMALPLYEYREKSIGVPFPDMSAKIIKTGTFDEAPAGEEGELCISGPAVMMGYLDNPQETEQTLRRHPDGLIWLHTGDIATMDEDGFFYFKLRAKRMIKSSGMNVYPAQVEDVLYQHPDVKDACVIGVPDAAQVQRVKAFVVLKEGCKSSPEKEKALIEHCSQSMIKWSCPREIEFRDKLPTTLVGKIAFNTLEKEEIARLKAEGKYTGE